MNLRELLADPIFLDLVEQFVSDLPGRISELDAAAKKADWETVRTLSHQLKGCGGGYGFSEISEVAFSLETLSRATEPDLIAIEEGIQVLSDYCSKAETKLEEHRSKV